MPEVYGLLQHWTKEERESGGSDLDEFLIENCLARARHDKCIPVSTVQLTWYELTQADIDLELAIQKEAGVKVPMCVWEPGDWLVRSRVKVEPAEDYVDRRPGWSRRQRD